MSRNPPIIPTATYRVQVAPEFTFDDANAIVNYLARLGISRFYASPNLEAMPGSQHGYDVADHEKVNSDRGGEIAYLRLCQTLKRHNLGQVLDIVPNHMSIEKRSNARWWDVLENGPASPYAFYFDVDWQSSDPTLRGKVLLPVLGDHYGRVLMAGQLRLRREVHCFVIQYFDHVFPVDPSSLAAILGTVAEKNKSETLAYLADALSSLPEEPTRRQRDKQVLKTLLMRLFTDELEITAAVDKALDHITKDYDVLDALLNAQNYRLAYWRTASAKLNYRRFFNINTLIGLRIENERVFETTHRLILKWVDDGWLDGLRIDHPDGLRDPLEYLQRLSSHAPDAWIVVEKILDMNEVLRDDWPVAGTTGYDFMNHVNGLFVDPKGEAPLTHLYGKFTGESTLYSQVVHAKKHVVLKLYFTSDVNRLTDLLAEIIEKYPCYRDYTRPELQDSIKELVASFPVYRTYVQADKGQVSPKDIEYIKQTVSTAKTNRPDLDDRLLDFIGELLKLHHRGVQESEFVMRFQQFTSPVAAKGVEDTAFYCYNRLISLNEVGGDPSRFGVPMSEFHAFCTHLADRWPVTMLSSSTHDTKRSEDVRARINLLSEIPNQWGAAVERWAAMNQRHHRGPWPDRNTEYFLYQTLVGAWPLPLDRALSYMSKAVNESKMHTSWVDPNPGYETALAEFITALYNDPNFMWDLEGFISPLRIPGWINSLAQTLIKLTAPGVPDIYQGTEIWDNSLVDPDNRRPVDYGLRDKMLDEIAAMSADQAWSRLADGYPKLYLIWKVLTLRKQHPDWFGATAKYVPIYAKGDYADHLVTFARGNQTLTVVPRMFMSLKNGWGDTVIELPQNRWINVLTSDEIFDDRVKPEIIFGKFPVALLAAKE